MKKTICLLISIVLASCWSVCALSDGSVWYCPQCGRQFSGDANFCSFDGTANPNSGSSSYSSSSSWPQRAWVGANTRLKMLNDEESRHQSKLGPGGTYHGAGAYKPRKVTSAMAMFKEGKYVYVDMKYQTVGHRCVYFLDYMLTDSSVEEVDLQGVSAATTSTITPRFGPGMDYDSFDEAQIVSNTSVSVFFECDGWLFAEFQCALGAARAWLPADQVVAR